MHPTRSASARALLAASVLAVGLARPGPAHAVGALATSGLEPVEQRIAVAVGPSQTTLWSSLRLEAGAGEVAIVAPLSAGASVDWASRAFFEALEAATAPRVIAPEGGPDACPGEAPSGPHVAGELASQAPLVPTETLVLSDADAVLAWAAAHGLDVAPALGAALAVSPASAFVVARFPAPAGTGLTPTLRIVTPAGASALPLVLVRAGAADLRIVTWSLGEGRASIEGTPVALDLGELVLSLGGPDSNYAALSLGALAPPGSVLVESASRASLRDAIPIGPATIPGVAATYFERAAAAGDAEGDPSTCAAQSAVVLGQSAVVGHACPPGAITVVAGGPPCTADATEPGEVDPSLLRCGGIADDLAVALSDLEPDEAWLTRAAVRVPAGTSAADLDVSFAPGLRLDPIVEASGVDLSTCGQGGAGGSSPGPGAGTGSGPSTGAGGISTGTGREFVEVPLRTFEGCGCSGTWVVVDYLDVPVEESPPDAYYVDESGDDCAGDTSSTYDSTESFESYDSSPTTDDCSGDTLESSDTAAGDDCSADTTDSSTGSDCSGDTSDTSTDGCGSDSGSDSGCSGDSGGSDDCAVARPARPRPIRISVLSFLGALVLLPLRRLARRRPRLG